MVFYAVLPFFLVLDVAMTSHECDKMMDTLNATRIKYGELCHDRIQWLEVSLKSLHREQVCLQYIHISGTTASSEVRLLIRLVLQGLGFTIGGLVLDRRKLIQLFVGLGGGLTSLITLLCKCLTSSLANITDRLANYLDRCDWLSWVVRIHCVCRRLDGGTTP